MNVTPNAQQAKYTALIVDDDQELCRMLTKYLEPDGFDVDAVHDGLAGVDRIRNANYDVIVMDLMMPVMDGFEALRNIRAFSNVPVLMLTARGEELDRIVGLEIGADDYLPKPFNPRELSARLKAILRRSRQDEKASTRLIAGDLELEIGSRSLRIDGALVPLTSTEYGVIELLFKFHGKVVSKQSLSSNVLGRRLTPFDRSLDTHIANLRKKLGPAPQGIPRIKTIRGEGYLLVSQ